MSWKDVVCLFSFCVFGVDQLLHVLLDLFG